MVPGSSFPSISMCALQLACICESWHLAYYHMTWSSFLQKGCFFFLKRRNSIPDAYNFPPGISLLKDCNDFHQAKDGDGWVEQSSQPFFFGLLQKVCTMIHFGESLFSNYTISILLSLSLSRKEKNMVILLKGCYIVNITVIMS
jgi:hypothetical protein